MRKCGLFWNRPVDNPEFLDAWLEEIRGYRAEAIEKGMKQFLKKEVMFPVPGSLIPWIVNQIDAFERKD